MDRQTGIVAAIATRARHLYADRIPWRVYHGSTHSTRNTAHTSNNTIDTSDLSHIVSIDPLTKTALVEPNVTMESLVRQTLPHLLPPVVPEFPVLIIGGALAGTAGESSSFRHRFVADTISWIEVVLPTGEVVGASRDSNQDLFHGIAGSFGTLGVVTLVKIELMEAKRFVELTYHPVRGIGRFRVFGGLCACWVGVIMLGVGERFVVVCIYILLFCSNVAYLILVQSTNMTIQRPVCGHIS